MALIIKTTGFEDYLDRSGGSWVKELIFGAPDVGKTRSASFWPKPIFADCEDGRMSIADRKVQYGRVRSSADMDALLEELRKDGLRPIEKRRWLTFVVDTLDHYQKILISERLKAEKKEALSGWADWGWLDGKMQQFVEKLLNLPMNIIVNVHVKDGKTDDDSPSTKKPRLKGDVADWILEEFDLIGHMETSYKAEQGERVRTRQIRWHNEPALPFLKDRSGKLPRFTDVDFTEDDYNRIFESITSGVDDLPASTDVETIEVPDDTVEPAGPDEKGGPVDVGTLPKAPAKKTAAKKAAATKATKAAASGGTVTKTEKKVEPEAPKNEPGTTEVPAAAEPAAETSTTVAESEPAVAAAATTDPAVDLVKDQLGGEVVDQVPTVRPEKYCGLQPESYKKFDDAPEGCGADLTGENTAKVNLTLLRAHAMLCGPCHEQWKANK